MKIAEDIMLEKTREIITISPEHTIEDALKIMNKHNIGAIFVKEGEDIIGIWTERDLMRNSLQKDFNPQTARIKDYMTTNLISVPYDEPLFKIIDILLGRRFRRLLVEKDGKYVGLISAGDVMKSFLIEKDKELKELNAIVSWDYYEDWRWKKK
jgi:CBS domain-containing protein